MLVVLARRLQLSQPNPHECPTQALQRPRVAPNRMRPQQGQPQAPRNLLPLRVGRLSRMHRADRVAAQHLTNQPRANHLQSLYQNQPPNQPQHLPPAPPVPDAPYPSVYSDGATFTVSWGTPNMNGATLAYYWVDVTNASYSTGDRHTPVYGNSISTNLNYPCAVIGIVTTEGVQSVSGVYCL